MAIYGLVLRSDPEADVQEWEVTEDVDDLLKAETMFVPCASAAEGRAELERRNPPPQKLKEAIAGKRMTLASVEQFYKFGRERFRVYRRARVTRVAKSWREVQHVSELVRGLIDAEGGVLGETEGTYSTASHYQVATALRKDPTFAASDLVIRKLKGTNDFEVVVDKKKAKARRTVAEARTQKQKIKSDTQTAADRASDHRRVVYGAAQKASMALWDSFPALKDIKANGLEYVRYLPESDQLQLFWKVVHVHESFGRKGRWRNTPEVVTLLDEYAKAGDAFDAKCLNPHYQGDGPVELRRLCDRLDVEVRRLARKRRREQCRRERAAKIEVKQQEPVAV